MDIEKARNLVRLLNELDAEADKHHPFEELLGELNDACGITNEDTKQIVALFHKDTKKFVKFTIVNDYVIEAVPLSAAVAGKDAAIDYEAVWQ